MYRPAGWVILLLCAAVVCISYLGFARYPASLSAIPYGHELLPLLAEWWREQRDLYASIFESKLGVFLRGHPMEMTGGYGLIGLFLLLSRGYRDAGWEHCLLVLWYGLFIPILCILGLIVARWGGDIFLFFGGGESGTTGLDRMRANPIGGLANAVGGLLIGVPVMLIGLVIGLVIRAAVYVAPPLYVLFGLFVLPSILWAVARIILSVPFFLWRSLHYVFVPHPAEAAYKRGSGKECTGERSENTGCKCGARIQGAIPGQHYLRNGKTTR